MKRKLLSISICLVVAFSTFLNLRPNSDGGFSLSFGHEVKAEVGDWCEKYVSTNTAVGQTVNSEGVIVVTYQECCVYVNSSSGWCNQSLDGASCPVRVCDPLPE